MCGTSRSGRGCLEFRGSMGSGSLECGGDNTMGITVVKSVGQVSVTTVQDDNVVREKVGRVSLEFRINVGGCR